MSKSCTDKLKFEELVVVFIILAFIILVGFFIHNMYQTSQHESLHFKIKTTYMKDGYSYTDEKSECVMYDPATIDDIDVIKRFQSKHAIEKKDHMEQKVIVTNDCTWIWMPKSEEIYR